MFKNYLKQIALFWLYMKSIAEDCWASGTSSPYFFFPLFSEGSMTEVHRIAELDSFLHKLLHAFQVKVPCSTRKVLTRSFFPEEVDNLLFSLTAGKMVPRENFSSFSLT